MGPIVINVDPVIVAVGHFALRWYGLMIALGIVAGFAIALREGRRKGLSEDDVYSVGTWGVVSAFVFARLFHVADHLDYYLVNPGAILAFQNGGLAIFGGIFGGVLGGIIAAKRQGVSVTRILDVAAPALVLGQAIGRVGCLFNGDSLGPATDLPWGFVYTNPNAMAPSLGVAYQPVPAYELLWDLAIFGFLWWLRKRVRIDGLLFLVYLSLYSVGKYALTFLRSEALVFAGFQEAQVVVLATLAVTLPLAAHLARRGSASAEVAQSE